MLLLSNFLITLPVWIYAVAGGAILVLITILVVFLPRRRFKRRLLRVVSEPDLAGSQIRDQYDHATLLQRSGLVVRIASRPGNDQLPSLIGIDELWIQRLLQTKHPKTMKRILQFAPDKGLFTCFVTTLEKPHMAPIFADWISNTDDFLILRRIALSGKGENFNGETALNVLREKIDELREMAGNPEWASRYFAIKIILNDGSDRSTRVVWDAFCDPYPLIRKTVATEFKGDDPDRMYNLLRDLLLDDPVFEVRNAARKRIAQDFQSRHTIDIEELSSWQAQHVLELLQKDDKNDEDTALRLLSSENLELRLTAALFISEAGVLDTLFTAIDFGDREGLERSFELLKKACEVNVCSFLDKIRKLDKPASLLIAARLLVEYGEREMITLLADRIFALSKEKKMSKDYFETYQTLLECIRKRGTDVSLKLLEREVNKYKNSPELLALLLPAIPERGDHIFFDILFQSLLDPEYPVKDTLRHALLRMPKPLLIPRLIDILKSERSAYPYEVRIQTIKLLGEMKENYCLQIILEHLPILPVEEGKTFSRMLSSYAGSVFDEKVKQLLESSDSSVRAALIASLPATEKRDFLGMIRETLKDAEPDVRIASIWSLIEFQDTKTVNLCFDMLRDPVERVRIEVAKAIGSCATAARVRDLKELIEDENEIDSVKIAAIQGLGFAEDPSSVEALCDVYEGAEELRSHIERALSGKTADRQLERLAEAFKDAVPVLRDGITAAAQGMKEKGEAAMVALLSQDISALKPYLAEILESTGYVEATIRRLSHRTPATRRAAAEILSIIGTPSAFRGIVMAARDPDREVRIQIIKALEKLETEEGKTILRQLESDPDKKVRKYTHWALERLRAKAL